MEENLKNFRDELGKASNLNEIEKVRFRFLGKKSFISKKMKTLPGLSAEKKAQLGKDLNRLKIVFQEAIDKKIETL